MLVVKIIGTGQGASIHAGASAGYLGTTIHTYEGDWQADNAGGSTQCQSNVQAVIENALTFGSALTAEGCFATCVAELGSRLRDVLTVSVYSADEVKKYPVTILKDLLWTIPIVRTVAVVAIVIIQAVRRAGPRAQHNGF